ncbi:NfeD family protein [Candidatus Rickettsia kedanie]|uniref:NfeD family protein n=1 Tax=Candidatus Rickettsia kedanie TaxID=3115352 RepID=A0ABP9TXL4_9RICK
MFMINNYLTEIWLIIGIICVVVEFFAVPNIGFLFFGFGALSNTLVVYNCPLVSLTNQITFFGILSLIWFCILYYPLKKYVYNKTDRTENYSDMIGKTVEVYSSTVSADTIGQVRWSGAIMNAYLAPNEIDAKTGEQLFITAVKGNVLICSKHRPKT